MTSKPNNYAEDIHNVNYETAYISKKITSDSMIYDHGRWKESLGGRWNFAIDQYDTCVRAKWYEEKVTDQEGRDLPIDFSFDEWETIQVPSVWNTQKDQWFLYEGSAVYTRKFKYLNRGEERVFLKFGAVSHEAKVFLNKQYLGMHQGASTPFYIEITGKLERNNRIIVVANNTRKRTNVPCENTDWFNYGGVYRDIELIRLPSTFIKNLQIGLVPNSNFSKILIDVEVDGKELSDEVQVEIAELGLNTSIPLIEGKAKKVIDATPKLWSPEHPKLYDVVVKYREDCINERIGFREIAVEGTQILLNGRPIYLKGISTHEESVLNGKAMSDEEIRENFRLAKDMNCNYMRLAHYPHSERASQIADEVGIMLWEEIPVYWAIEFNNDDTYKDAANQLSELIKRDINRASVIIWSVGNENANTKSRLSFMSRLVELARELDPTRLISAACMLDHENHIIDDHLAEHLDIIGANQYYGWYQTDFNNLIKLFENSKPTKPVIITEFGADARPGHRGTADEKGTEDCQLDIYIKQISVLDQIPYVKGMCPWILYDFRCPRRLHFTQNYYNTKGLLSADKNYKKLAFFAMKNYYSTKTNSLEGSIG